MVAAEALAAAVASNNTPLQHMLSVQNDPNETPERRLAASIAAAPYVHPRLQVTEAKVQVAAVVVTQEELAARADREIFEVFGAPGTAYTPPLLEHRSMGEPATVPAQPIEKREPREQDEDYAAPGAPAADRVVRMNRRYRPPRGGSSMGA